MNVSFIRKIKTNEKTGDANYHIPSSVMQVKKVLLLWWRLPSPTGSGADSMLDRNHRSAKCRKERCPEA
uniref:Uncharacterized protein n=1 Tax=Siphoviridae sp. ctm7X10 TaxID=2827929 RepID=A0A8S5S575_9CAUD|nr:MAG TPA: hypothetical protein [Siphoviridae sp. ctm7X10]